MATTLCFDFGNTRMKCAVFVDGNFVAEQVLADDSDATVKMLLDQYHPDKSILSSVIDHNPGMETLLQQHTHFHRLGHQSRLPVTTPVGKPETIGADRLALVVAAVTLFPGKNNLVIGLGSAITYNYVNKYKEFIGGGISPGMEMRFKSLNAFTAKLPLVKADWNFPLAGYDTRTNILSGVILGMAKEVDGIIEAYEEKYDNFNVLLSGGDSAYFTRHLKKKIFVDPHLIYKGLYAISEYNQ
ncbi:type III pantothenate kinase [Puia dinghuensis]|uniref:Type III pantothenate kinase n=1 Tax=Puia dinghuensis TaxID=1792502 RepID=A0A8J2UFD4_9BACT|nr:type III pantothenate kinase [Puia dinghuensis]GGB09844.1 type III pantothenate kinase [Puia dinghuensis]